MKIITANVNGVRAATKKGFWTWFGEQNADVLCLQELKAHEHQLPDQARPDSYHRYFHFAEKPGYSGVALYCREKPDAVHIGLGSIDPGTGWSRFDAEGRFIMADFGQVSVICVYFPSGSSSPDRQAGKMVFLEQFLPLMERLKNQGRELIVCGDINIAHRNIDLKNWRGNQKNSGFLPEERAWFGQWLDAGFIDVFRQLYPGKEQYSWWSNRGRARENNIGWRIDYFCVDKTARQKVTGAAILQEVTGSDHCPVQLEYLPR